jgi:hypothetical protein
VIVAVAVVVVVHEVLLHLPQTPTLAALPPFVLSASHNEFARGSASVDGQPRFIHRVGSQSTKTDSVGLLNQDAFQHFRWSDRIGSH